MRSSASSSSSSSYDSQYYSAIPSPSNKDFAHDGFVVFREDIHMKSSPSAAEAVPSSSSSSSQCSSFTPSPSTSRENTHCGVSINSYRSEDDKRLRASWSTSIASSSNSSSQTSTANPSPSINHDVFISFRGQDTRNGFVSHLRAAFTRHGIKTYVDYDLERGNEISSSLLVEIKKSKILLLVFSANYAESRWTLDELSKIMECKRTRGQHVIPIFYKVSPSDVRHQRGNYEAALKRHKKLFRANNDTVQQWTRAMTEAANLSGWECSDFRSEAELVEEIANGVMRKLESMRIASEVGGASLLGSHHNYSDEPNSGDSQDHTPEESFPNKCLSSNRRNILGNLRHVLWRRENERLVLNGREQPDAPSSSSHTPNTIVYRNRYLLKQGQPWWVIASAQHS